MQTNHHQTSPCRTLLWSVGANTPKMLNNTYLAEFDNDTSDSDSAYEVYDIKNVPSLLSSYDESFDEDSEIFSMTSLNAIVFLSQNETNYMSGAKKEDSSLERTRLSVAYERLHNFPKILLHGLSDRITILDLSHNEFQALDFLEHFPKLNSVICDHNNITSNTRIPKMPKLELLWMNHCQIKELYPWAHKLQESCPNLKYLSLMGNVAAPSYLNGGNFYEYLQYRLFIIHLFPNLIHLDDRAVSEDQRENANKLYKKPMMKRIVSTTPELMPTFLRKKSLKLEPEIIAQIGSKNSPDRNGII